MLAVIAAALAIDPGFMSRLRRFDPRESAARQERRTALPALVDAVAAALASGLSLELAFAEVAPTLPSSLSPACRRVAAALRLGIPLDRAFVALANVVPVEDLAPFNVVLGAFVKNGGRVRRSLGRVAALMRARLALEDERAALTAQARLSAIVLIALAPLGAIFFALAMPTYIDVLSGDGRPLLFAALAFEVVGGLWLRRIVRLTGDLQDVSSLIDAVVVGLESGLTFQQSLRTLVARAPKVARLPEARRLLADLSLGQGSAASFNAFASSGPAEARVAGLVRSANRLGAPLVDLLVTQAESLREAERRRAEARARRLPILMLFPLTFCILPALLIVFLGPPLLSITR